MFENPAQVPYPQPYILWCWIDMREDGCCVVTELRAVTTRARVIVGPSLGGYDGAQNVTVEER